MGSQTISPSTVASVGNASLHLFRAAREARDATFIGLWLSAVVLPNMLVPLVPKLEVVPNKLIVALKNNRKCEGQALS